MAYKPKCLIFGHSFIKRLERKQRTEPGTFKADFGLYRCRITLRGFSGLNFGLEDGEAEKKFYAIVDSVFRRSAYDIVICQLGGNDISEKISPSVLRDGIIKFVQYIRDKYNVKIIYICSVFTRPHPRGITPNAYETFRGQINSLTEEYTQKHSANIVFWPHKRIFHSPQCLFEHDGTHLNCAGEKKFYKSLRLAAIFAVEKYIA